MAPSHPPHPGEPRLASGRVGARSRRLRATRRASSTDLGPELRFGLERARDASRDLGLKRRSIASSPPAAVDLGAARPRELRLASSHAAHRAARRRACQAQAAADLGGPGLWPDPSEGSPRARAHRAGLRKARVPLGHAGRDLRVEALAERGGDRRGIVEEARNPRGASDLCAFRPSRPQGDSDGPRPARASEHDLGLVRRTARETGEVRRPREAWLPGAQPRERSLRRVRSAGRPVRGAKGRPFEPQGRHARTRGTRGALDLGREAKRSWRIPGQARGTSVPRAWWRPRSPGSRCRGPVTRHVASCALQDFEGLAP